MRLIVYDCEVFCEDWLVILKDIETGQYTVIHNDTEEMKQCISEDCIYVGFNSKDKTMKNNLTDTQINTLAKPLIRILDEFYRDPKNVEEFQKWLQNKSCDKNKNIERIESGKE